MLEKFVDISNENAEFNEIRLEEGNTIVNDRHQDLREDDEELMVQPKNERGNIPQVTTHLFFTT